MKKINVITLGCSKNTVDSEHLMARLAAAGYEVLFDSDRTDAKVVVINTCGFIGDAKQESIDMILRAAAAKQAGKIERLFVVGCLSERYADELRAEAELEEARAFSRGRIAPRYLLKYVAVILLSLFGLAVLVDAIVPGLIPGNPLAAMRDFSAAGADWLASVMDF